MKLRNPWLWLVAAWFLAYAVYANAQVPTVSMCETFFGNNGGSGVVVGQRESHTYVLTCNHILDGVQGGRAFVKFSNGTRLSAQLQRPRGFPDDLLMFCTSRVDIPAVPIAQSVQIGEAVWKAGFPATTQGTSPLNIQKGTWRGSGLFDCYVWSGDSGGGVFNAKGELLGIISGYDTQSSLCSSLSSTKKFVSNWSHIFTQAYCYPGGYCQPQQYCPPQISYGGTPRPQYPSPSVPGSQPAPTPQTPTPATPPSSGQCSCDDIRASLAAIKVNVDANIKRLETIKNGLDGRDGKDGERGLQGPPGKQGERGLPGKDGKDAPPVDADAIVVAVVERLKQIPIRMKQRDPYTGDIVADELVYLGDSVTLDTSVNPPTD